MSTAVKKKEDNLPPAMMADFEADAGHGFENADKDSYAIPFIKLLQSMTQQCKKSNGAYIQGAEEGMLLNTVTEEIMDGEAGITVIPVEYERVFIEWESTEPGSGLVDVHDVAKGQEMLQETTRDDKNNDVLPSGHCLVDMRQHYVLVVREDGTTYPALIGMSKSQLKVSRKWMSAMNGITIKGAKGVFTPPTYSHRYRLCSVAENRNGNDYMNWKAVLVGPVEDAEQYAAAKALRQALTSGKAKADHSQMADGTAEDKEDVPF